MDLIKYGEFAKTTKQYPTNLNIVYPTIGLSGEVGEVCEKIKKVYRDKDGIFTSDTVDDIIKELGDCMWYIHAIADDLDRSIDDACKSNYEKLTSRLERNAIKGNGDNRWNPQTL